MISAAVKDWGLERNKVDLSGLLTHQNENWNIYRAIIKKGSDRRTKTNGFD